MMPQSPQKNNPLYKNATMKMIDEALDLLSPCILARLQPHYEKSCHPETGHLVAWNPFREKYANRNTAIVGAAGSGKSSMIHALVHSTLDLGGRVFVLDTYGDFEKRTTLTDKQCVEVSPFVGLNLNPFEMMPLDNPLLIKDGLLLIKCVLAQMIMPGSMELSIEAEDILKEALLETWNYYHAQATLTHVYAYLLGNETEISDELAALLYPYTEDGVYGHFFKGTKHTPNFTSPLVIAKLEALVDFGFTGTLDEQKERQKLQTVIVQMFMVHCVMHMLSKDSKTPFLIVLDEAWDMLRGAQSGVFIETLSYTVQFHNGAVVSASENVELNHASQASFDQSLWTCYLSKNPKDIATLQSAEQILLDATTYESLTESLNAHPKLHAVGVMIKPYGYSGGRLLLGKSPQFLVSLERKDVDLRVSKKKAA